MVLLSANVFYRTIYIFFSLSTHAGAFRVLYFSVTYLLGGRGVCSPQCAGLLFISSIIKAIIYVRRTTGVK